MPTIYELVYRSRRREGVSDETLVNKVFLPATRRNHAQDVTGCLWFDRLRFLGVLEGAEDAVLREFEGLSKDPYHQNVQLIAAGTAPTRLFTRWGIRAVDQHPGETLARFESEFSDRAPLRGGRVDLPLLVTILRKRLPFPPDLVADPL